MPYSITVCDTLIKYTVTTPNWFCEWIVGGKYVGRMCRIVSVPTLDPTHGDDLEYICRIIPEIVDEVDKAVKAWIEADDIYAGILLTPENIPLYLQYAKTLKGL